MVEQVKAQWLPILCIIFSAGTLQAQVYTNTSRIAEWNDSRESSIKTAQKVETLDGVVKAMAEEQKESSKGFQVMFSTFLKQQGEMLAELKAQRVDINNIKEDIKEFSYEFKK